MEDNQGLRLKKNHAIMLNSVQTYLRVSYLSEIVDHTGTTLLPYMLQPSPLLDNVFH